jgi:hypothetical protein
MTDKATAVTKRGRPAIGEQPTSAAERKRAQRQRDSQAVMAAIGDETNAPLRVLLAILARVEASKSTRLAAQHAWTEIGRRYGFVGATERPNTEKTPSRNSE